jgi:PAS domain S-box-containing protein
MYFEGTRSFTLPAPPAGTSLGAGQPQRDAGLHRQFDQWVFGITITMVSGGIGSLVTMFMGLASWRRTCAQRQAAKEEEWRKMTTSLQLQLAETRKSEEMLQRAQAEIQEQSANLTAANAQLKSELSQLKKAERTASQERQVLESSKTVLELHVQTRTRELQKLQRRYEMILNSAGEGICGLDVEGKATFVNPAVAKITGWPLSELIGKTEQEIFDAYKPENEPPPTRPQPGERIYYRKDGSYCPLEFVKTPINENGTVVGAVLVFKDITERKRVEDTLAHKASELARSNAELEQFAFVASHDLQEPLRKIQAFGDRLFTKCEGAIAPEAQDYLTRMQSAAARMRTLINDLLTFSRVIRSSEPFVQVDLDVVAKEIIGDLEVRIEKAGARVEVGEMPCIEADPMQMRQLLLNLIGNALKFQVPGSQPVVKVSSRLFSTKNGDQFCELTVQDNGIGFDEKYLDKIFAVFQRLHGRTEYEGTGVGLAICRRISDRHHGNIIARSQLGKGATFIVTLPVRQPKADEA